MSKASDKQRALEAKMADTGRSRATTLKNDARARGIETATKPGRLLLSNAVAKMSDAVTKWRRGAVARAAAGRGQIPAEALDAIRPIRSSVLALIVCRAVIDGIGHERTYTSVASEVGRAVEDEARLAAVRKARGPAWRALKKTALADHRRAARASRARRFLRQIHDAPLPSIADKPRILIGATLVELMLKSTGLIEVRAGVPRQRRRRGPAVIHAASGVLEWLERSWEAHLIRAPLYLPTVDVPADWSTPSGGGYLTDLALRKPLVVSRNPEHLKHLRQAEMPAVYAAVNALQRTPWEVNRAVHAVAAEVVARGLGGRVGLPEMDDRKVPEVPAGVQRDTEEWKDVRRARAMIHQFNVSQRSGRIAVARTLACAEMFSGAPLHFPHHLDFRGRIYPTPGFLNPQGSDLAAGLLRFVEDRDRGGDRARWWWLIHGANTFGLDKDPLHERVDWAETEGVQMAERVARDPMGTIGVWGKADKPFQFLAWCLESLESHDRTRLPVMLDGSNNGLQIYSLLLGDEAGARATNCLPCDRPNDMYQDVADVATCSLFADAERGVLLAQRWRALLGPKGLPRAATKRATMTNPYGSTLFACQRYVGDWYEEAYGKSHDWGRLWWQAMKYLSDKVWDAIEQCAPSAITGRKWFRAVADVCSAHGERVRWIAPSGFPVIQRYPRILSNKLDVRSLMGDSAKVRSFRAGIEDWTELDRTRQRDGLAPNVIHSYDAAVAAETISRFVTNPLFPDEPIGAIRAVHDGFGTHADRTDALLHALKSEYVSIFSLDLLGRFAQDVSSGLPSGVRLPPTPTRGKLDVSQVLQSDYFFS